MKNTKTEANLMSNDKIRALLNKDLSKAELKAIAMLRSIRGSTKEEIKRNILKNLERQEGYERLLTH